VRHEADATGLGRVILGGRFGERSGEISSELLSCFAEFGGIWVETAHSYAGGRAELAIAEAIATVARPLQVITKVGHPDERGTPSLDPITLARQIEVSVERLGRSVDLLMLHRDDHRVSVPSLLEPVMRALDHGLARAVGVSNWTLMRARAAKQVIGGRLWAISLQFSVVVPRQPLWPQTRVADRADLDWVEASGLSFFGWSPLARGWISDPESAPSEAYAAFSTSENYEVLSECDRLAGHYACSRSAIALAATLSAGSFINPVLGAERVGDIVDAMKAVELAAHERLPALDALASRRRGWSSEPD
jgi:aryl-alcohol dehydrogenase-like predicted oxidoreductase